jgi:hypothetical protein
MVHVTSAGARAGDPHTVHQPLREERPENRSRVHQVAELEGLFASMIGYFK